MNFDSLLAYYQKNVPAGPEAPGTDAWNNRFNSWTSQLEKELGIPGGDFNDPASGWAGIDEAKLSEFETQGGGSPGTTTTIPLEQELLGRTLDQYVYPGFERDAKNQAAADAAVAAGNRSLDNVLTQNQANINSGFSAEAYLRNNNPDPASWEAGRASLQAIVDAGLATDLNKAAEYHYNTYGKAEGKKPGIVGALAAELANADEAQAGLTAAARTEQAANEAANFANTGVQRTAITANEVQQQGAINAEHNTRSLAQLTAEREQSDALTAQNAARLRDQAAATAALRTAQQAKEGESLTALTARTAQVDTATAAHEAARQTALAKATAELRAGSDTLDVNRKAALAEQIAKLNSGSDALTESSLAALAQETASLGAAFDVSAAARERNLGVLEGTRLEAAQGQVTGINLGLERTRDELAARAATQGYVGNSSMGDANLVRATVGARQNAAGVVGDVNVQNAGDRRTLGDTIAGQRFDLAGRDATGRRTLATDGAGRTFEILQGGAADGRTIADDGSARRYDITKGAAVDGRAITDEGAAGRLDNAALDATDRYGVRTTGAGERAEITDLDAAGNLATGNLTSTARNTLAATGATARETRVGTTAAAHTALATTGANRLLTLAGTAGERTLANAATANEAIAGAARTTTGMKSDYFDANGKRTLAAALIPQQVATDRLALIGAGERVGYAGVRAGQDLLGWYSGNATPPPAGTFTTQPSQTGNGIAALGAGVTSGAISVGNSMNWGRPRTPAVNPASGNSVNTITPGL